MLFKINKTEIKNINDNKTLAIGSKNLFITSFLTYCL
jgi:hypothetical protein